MFQQDFVCVSMRVFYIFYILRKALATCGRVAGACFPAKRPISEFLSFLRMCPAAAGAFFPAKRPILGFPSKYHSSGRPEADREWGSGGRMPPSKVQASPCGLITQVGLAIYPNS